MLIKIHEEMTREALSSHFSPRALEIIVAANLKQDSLRGQLGHDEFHFDNNAIEKSSRYINEQRGYVLATLMTPAILSAWIAFGRLLHTAQDFYSHTNYISIWLSQREGAPPSPFEVDPVKKDILHSPGLYSGKIYFPLDALYFVPFLREFSLRFLPNDSHGRMNLDSPAQGSNFAYARAAAVKRTQHEFSILQKLLTPDMFARFVDI